MADILDISQYQWSQNAEARPGSGFNMQVCSTVIWESHTDGGDNGATEEESAGQVPTVLNVALLLGSTPTLIACCHLLYRDNGL